MASHCLAKAVENQLRQLPGNNICCDCDAKGPQWASVSFGIFMCLECSGRHRALGVHISFVRSVTMDSWSEKQIQMMKLGGNDRFNNFLKEYDVPKTLPIQEKYHTSAAQYYREKLSAEVNGTSPPSQLPSKHSQGSNKIADIHTSDPLPGETEADYIARQRRIQEEARERMRQKFGQSNGLSSSGRMQGIGSDSSYRPGQSSSNGIDFPSLDVNQLADASQKALSFFQSSFAVIGETVTKTTTQLLDDNSYQPSGSSSDSQAGNSLTWGSLTTGAINLWKQAADATTDILVQISAGDEEQDFKFPRPPDHSTSSNKMNQRDANDSNIDYRGSSADRIPPAVPSVQYPSVAPTHRQPLDGRTQANAEVTPSPRTPSYQTSTSAPKAKSAPVGEDFFATFGV